MFIINNFTYIIFSHSLKSEKRDIHVLWERLAGEILYLTTQLSVLLM